MHKCTCRASLNDYAWCPKISLMPNEFQERLIMIRSSKKKFKFRSGVIDAHSWPCICIHRWHESDTITTGGWDQHKQIMLKISPLSHQHFFACRMWIVPICTRATVNTSILISTIAVKVSDGPFLTRVEMIIRR